MFARRNTITDSRIEKRKWALASDDPALTEFFEIDPVIYPAHSFVWPSKSTEDRSTRKAYDKMQKAILPMNRPMMNC